MIEILLMLVLYIVLFALQDIIADYFGWYLKSGPQKTFYVISTIIITAIGRIVF